jgi:hypothetical protein
VILGWRSAAACLGAIALTGAAMGLFAAASLATTTEEESPGIPYACLLPDGTTAVPAFPVEVRGPSTDPTAGLPFTLTWHLGTPAVSAFAVPSDLPTGVLTLIGALSWPVPTETTTTPTPAPTASTPQPAPAARISSSPPPTTGDSATDPPIDATPAPVDTPTPAADGDPPSDERAADSRPEAEAADDQDEHLDDEDPATMTPADTTAPGTVDTPTPGLDPEETGTPGADTGESGTPGADTEETPGRVLVPMTTDGVAAVSCAVASGATPATVVVTVRPSGTETTPSAGTTPASPTVTPSEQTSSPAPDAEGDVAGEDTPGDATPAATRTALAYGTATLVPLPSDTPLPLPDMTADVTVTATGLVTFTAERFVLGIAPTPGADPGQIGDGGDDSPSPSPTPTTESPVTSPTTSPVTSPTTSPTPTRTRTGTVTATATASPSPRPTHTVWVTETAQVKKTPKGWANTGTATDDTRVAWTLLGTGTALLCVAAFAGVALRRRAAAHVVAPVRRATAAGQGIGPAADEPPLPGTGHGPVDDQGREDGGGAGEP